MRIKCYRTLGIIVLYGYAVRLWYTRKWIGLITQHYRLLKEYDKDLCIFHILWLVSICIDK